MPIEGLHIGRFVLVFPNVALEDVDIVEKVQAEISTPEYEGGRMCYRFEEPVHRFQNMIIDRMVGIERIPDGHRVEQSPMFGAANPDIWDQQKESRSF